MKENLLKTVATIMLMLAFITVNAQPWTTLVKSKNPNFYEIDGSEKIEVISSKIEQIITL